MATRKLVFYSGGQKRENNILHEGLSHLAGSGKHKSLTYIPYTSEHADWYFKRAVNRYKKFDFEKFHCLKVDGPKLSKKEIKRALSSDAIYLAGGNTFYFLKHLRRQQMLTKLHDYAFTGGVLAGLSAGGIIMTPHIYLASYPKSDADPNTVNLRNWNALHVVEFEFSPHYYKGHERSLLRYSKKTKNPIFAATDGSGIIMHNETAEFFGRVYKFHHGTMIQLS